MGTGIKEKKYSPATIEALQGKIRKLKFRERSVSPRGRGRKKRLIRENKAQRDKFQKIKNTPEMPTRSQKDQKTIANLMVRVQGYDVILAKTQKELEKDRERIIQLGEDMKNLLRLAQQAKQNHDEEIFGLRKDLNAFEEAMS